MFRNPFMEFIQCVRNFRGHFVSKHSSGLLSDILQADMYEL